MYATDLQLTEQWRFPWGVGGNFNAFFELQISIHLLLHIMFSPAVFTWYTLLDDYQGPKPVSFVFKHNTKKVTKNKWNGCAISFTLISFSFSISFFHWYFQGDEKYNIIILYHKKYILSVFFINHRTNKSTADREIIMKFQDFTVISFLTQGTHFYVHLPHDIYHILQ